LMDKKPQVLICMDLQDWVYSKSNALFVAVLGLLLNPREAQDVNSGSYGFLSRFGDLDLF